MTDLISYLSKFDQQKILIVGDIIADEFIIGEPERLSREAPVLILRHNESSILPGGGTNAANNVADLGGEVYLAGVIGADRMGERLKKYLAEKQIKTDGLIVDDSRPTSVKTRILAGGGQTVKQQVVRIDKLENSHVDPEIEEKLLAYVEEVIAEVEAVILSDYGNGVFTPRIKERVIELARDEEKLVTVDSRYELLSFEGISIATPNKEETEQVLGFKLDSREQIDRAGQALLEKLAAEAMLITLGGEGMALFTEPGESGTYIPAANFTEVFDVTGAGDTVIGALTLALASGAAFEEAMRIANHAAGIVVRKAGVATTDREEVRKMIEDRG
ncbi:bifunctional heptose 7-phosphate kinase/heptose 1-phosphate adenyltransferase [Fuchsiella alkaliacetigena]|uniref:bifunctional heptose 7-phosphate kinase/heptose 1-phosphate adenyltransferase n=1 Tax=Fuchsiella alkaliacetigena TaxID=957042 RepID=UPI00200B65DB|nr:PfkB family carbohydrate kinase [Fuchsiella alkaliacetigena]MCK8824313.1 bifunctional ADP-heptose synthase [Fuchsiella alkaliacetigena]